MLTALAFSTALLVSLTLLPVLRVKHWLVRSLDFPRLQLATLALLLLAAELAWLDLRQPESWALLAATLLCLGWQAWWIVPYTSVWPREVESAPRDADRARRVRIMVANVLASNRDAQALLDLVDAREPDLLVTLETDDWWQARLDRLQARMPHAIKCARDNLYGMHVYSRLEFESSEIAYLVEPDKPSMHARVRLDSGDAIGMHFLHPAPPAPGENDSSQERDAELVIVARSVAQRSDPVVVTGDLNDVAWSSTTRLFRKLSGLLDPRIGRGMFNTFHAKIPLLRWPLDHLFHSKHFTVGAVERLPRIGSDHFPLLAELWLTPARGADQQGIDADPGERQRARSIAAEEDVDAAQVPKPR